MTMKTTSEWKWAGKYDGVGTTYPSREVAEENIPGWERIYPNHEFRVAECIDPYFPAGRWIVEYRAR